MNIFKFLSSLPMMMLIMIYDDNADYDDDENYNINGDVNDRSHLWLSMTIGMTRGYVEHAFSLHRHHLMMTMMMTLMTLFRILYVSSQTPAVPTKALDRLAKVRKPEVKIKVGQERQLAPLNF